MSEPTRDEIAMVPQDVLARSREVDKQAGQYAAAFAMVPDIARRAAMLNTGLSAGGALEKLCADLLGAVDEIAAELRTHSGLLERTAKDMKRLDDERAEATVAQTLGTWPGHEGRG